MNEMITRTHFLGLEIPRSGLLIAGGLTPKKTHLRNIGFPPVLYWFAGKYCL